MDTRTRYVEKLSVQLVAWDNQISLLKDTALSTAPEVADKYAGAIAALQLKRDQAAARLQSISVAGDDEWDEIKTGTENIWGEVRSMLQSTITKIR